MIAPLLLCAAVGFLIVQQEDIARLVVAIWIAATFFGGLLVKSPSQGVQRIAMILNDGFFVLGVVFALLKIQI